MKVLVLFLIGAFVSAALPRVRNLLTKRWIFIPLCVLVAASYLSLKVSA